MSADRPTPARNPQLDLLRGCAVLMVIASHYPCCKLAEAGWVGVDLFFVLSGFLISGLLFAELKQRESVSIGRFLIRRGLKIYPGFYFFLAMTTLMHPPFVGWSLLHEALFVQNYTPHIWGHTWSLAVEEHFYLGLPLLVVLLGRKRLHWIPIITTCAILVCGVSRVYVGYHGGSTEDVVYRTHLRVDALLAGVSISYWYHFRSTLFHRLSRWWLGAIGFGFVALNLLSPDPVPHVRAWLTIANIIGFSCILVWSMTRWRVRFALLEQIGFYSYSIYLWHLLCAGIWRQYTPTVFRFSGNILTAVVVGITMAILVETPVLRMRDRWFPSVAHSTQPQLPPPDDAASDPVNSVPFAPNCTAALTSLAAGSVMLPVSAKLP